LFVGGQFGRIEYLLCGSALKQAFECESYASPGDVIISCEAYQWVKEKYVWGRPMYAEEVDGYAVQSPQTHGKGSKKGGKSKPVVLQAPVSREPVVFQVQLERKKYQRVHSKALRSNGRYLISEHLQAFVPRAAWQRLLLRFKPWHGEQRAVTVLFINLDFSAFDCDGFTNLENMQDVLQDAVKTTQKCIYRYKGSLNKFLFDDKGRTVIAVFGLPPIANFDDCTRAVLAALLIEQKMKSLRIKARIGVTTGRVYIGVVGAAGSASEYGILGDQVNLAARLMQHAIKKTSAGGLGGEGVVVSDTTYAQAKECINIDWERLQSTSVKGFSKEFLIWRPHWRKIQGSLSMKRNRFFIGGWKDTMGEIKTRLLKLTRNHKKSGGYVIAIYADHWGGATIFARQLLHDISEQIYVVGTTNLPFNEEKLFAWKALLARIVRELRLLRGSNNGDSSADSKAADDKFKASFERFVRDTGGAHLVPKLPVLNELLNTSFSTSDALVRSIVPWGPWLEDESGELEQSQQYDHFKLKSYLPSELDAVAQSVAGTTESPSLDLSPDMEHSLQLPDTETEGSSLKNSMSESEKEALLLEYRVELIVHLLRQVSKYSTMVILVSKFQYMGLADWAITETIAKKIKQAELKDVSLVVAGWSMDTESLTYLVSPEDKAIRRNFERIKKLCWLECVLPKWTRQEVRHFLKFEFDIEKLSNNVLHFIVNKTDGIPGMVKCLVHDQNLLFLKHGGHLDCSQIERCGDIQSGSRYSDINLPIPYAIQSYYTKMLDSLDQFALLTIKTAAVMAVGQEFLSVSFSYDILHSCHPLRSGHAEHSNKSFSEELHAALSLLERDRFVYKFKQNKMTQEMIRLSDHENHKHCHDTETFYVFTSGFLRDVAYGNMLYKQRSAIHKRIKKVLDPFHTDDLVQNCIRRHHLLSLHDGFYSNRDAIEKKREEILRASSATGRVRKLNYRTNQHHAIWFFPECVMVLYIQDVLGLPDALKPASYVTIHVGDDKGKSLAQSLTCHGQYMSVVLNEPILKQIEDETVGPVLTMRLWFRQNYRVDKTIGKFTLRLRDLYEKQLSDQMLWLQRKSELSLNNNALTSSEMGGPQHGGRHGARLSHEKLHTHGGHTPQQQHAAIYDHTDLFVGYKMSVQTKQKKINRFHLEKQLYIESFIRFCTVDDGSKTHHNLQSMPSAS